MNAIGGLILIVTSLMILGLPSVVEPRGLGLANEKDLEALLTFGRGHGGGGGRRGGGHNNCKRRTTTTSTTTEPPLVFTTTTTSPIQGRCSEYDYTPACKTTWAANPNLLGGPKEIDVCSDFEGKCVSPPVATNLDTNWFNSVRQWYVPKLHRMDRYRRAQDLLNRGGPIDHTQLTNGCLRFDNLNKKISGFTDKTVSFTSTQLIGTDKDKFGWTVSRANGDESWSSVITITFTDNKNYFVGVNCWKDDSKGFFVGSTTKTLSAQDDAAIEAHLVSLGFSKCHFTTASTSTCPNLTA